MSLDTISAQQSEVRNRETAMTVRRVLLDGMRDHFMMQREITSLKFCNVELQLHTAQHTLQSKLCVDNELKNFQNLPFRVDEFPFSAFQL